VHPGLSLSGHGNSFLRKPLVVFIASLSILAYTFFLPLFSGAISSNPIALKIVLVIIVLTPLGFIMGIPFPTGLKILSEEALAQKYNAYLPVDITCVEDISIAFRVNFSRVSIG
jgi:hypothetical protein